MSIKSNLGRLNLAPSYEEFVKREISESNIIILNIELDHLKINASLAFHHRDPFDRIIIAQSMAENITIMTVDSIFSQYPITLI
ncbi:MAG: type II toxin-antitoxin system VapC family toxin [Microcystaceae cyanobacterium]